MTADDVVVSSAGACCGALGATYGAGSYGVVSCVGVGG